MKDEPTVSIALLTLVETFAHPAIVVLPPLIVFVTVRVSCKEADPVIVTVFEKLPELALRSHLFVVLPSELPDATGMKSPAVTIELKKEPPMNTLPETLKSPSTLLVP